VLNYKRLFIAHKFILTNTYDILTGIKKVLFMTVQLNPVKHNLI